MNESNLILIYIATLGMFFSATSWLNKRSRSPNYKVGGTTRKTKLEAYTHTILGGGISVFFYALAQHYFPEWSIVLQGASGVVAGSLLSEVILRFAERKINNA